MRPVLRNFGRLFPDFRDSAMIRRRLSEFELK
jgi:hypothetical protein